MIIECKKGTFGSECERTCGKCLNMTHCHQVNGTCLHGCELGYQGHRCQKS